MREIILKYIEYQKHKFDILHCQHNFVEKERWLNTNEDLYTKAKRQFTIIHYFCSKCGEFKKVNSNED